MKKVLVLLCAVVLLLLVSSVWKPPAPVSNPPAEKSTIQVSMPVKVSAPAPARTPVPAAPAAVQQFVTNAAVGTVEKIIPLIGTNPPGMEITDEKGERLKLITNASTVKVDKDGATILLREFKVGGKVAVSYTTNERGVHKALSIKGLD